MDKACEPCLKTGSTKKAVVLCLECEENYCSDCENYHLKFRTTSQHNLHKLKDGEIDIDAVESNKLLKSIVACPGHASETVEYQCQDHDQFCCIKCAFAYHRKCEEVVSLTDLVQRKDDIINDAELSTRIEKLETTSERLYNQEHAQRETVLLSCVGVEDCVKSFKEKIHHACKKVEAKVLSKNEEIKRTLLETIESREVQISEEKAKLEKLKKQHGIVAKYGDPVHHLVAGKLLQKEIGERATALTSIGDSHVSNETAVNEKVSVDSIVRSIEDALEVCEVTEEELASSTMEQEESLQALPSYRDFKERIPTLLFSVDLHSDKNIRNCVWFGKYIVSILGKTCQVIVFDTESRIITDTHQINSFPSSTCITTNNQICVCLPDVSKILLLEIKDSKVSLVKTVSTQIQVFDLAYDRVKNRTYALSREAKSIETVDMETGQSVKLATGVSQDFLSLGFVACDENCDRLLLSYASSISSDKFITTDMNGEVIFKYNAVGLKCPCYTTTDNDSNIYIANWGNAGFHQLDKSGEFIRKILTDVQKPKCMCFNEDMTQIAVLVASSPPVLQVYEFI